MQPLSNDRASAYEPASGTARAESERGREPARFELPPEAAGARPEGAGRRPEEGAAETGRDDRRRADDRDDRRTREERARERDERRADPASRADRKERPDDKDETDGAKSTPHESLVARTLADLGAHRAGLRARGAQTGEEVGALSGRAAGKGAQLEKALQDGAPPKNASGDAATPALRPELPVRAEARGEARLPQAAPDAAPAQRVAQAVQADAGLTIALWNQTARIRVEGERGELDLRLRVRDGVADVRVVGEASHLLAPRTHELKEALAGEGLGLGNFQFGGQDAGQGEREGGADRADAPEHAVAVRAATRRFASTASAASGSASGSPEPSRASGLHVTA